MGTNHTASSWRIVSASAKNAQNPLSCALLAHGTKTGKQIA